MVRSRQEAEAAQSLINGGADVLLQNTDSSAPLQVAEKAGKYGFGWDSDMKHLRTESPPRLVDHQLGAVLHQGGQAGAGRDLEGRDNWWGIKEGAVDLVTFRTPCRPT